MDHGFHGYLKLPESISYFDQRVQKHTCFHENLLEGPKYNVC